MQLIGEEANTNDIVFGLIRSSYQSTALEASTPNHYTTNLPHSRQAHLTITSPMWFICIYNKHSKWSIVYVISLVWWIWRFDGQLRFDG